MTAKVTKTRWTLPGALFATLAGTIASVMVAKLMQLINNLTKLSAKLILETS